MLRSVAARRPRRAWRHFRLGQFPCANLEEAGTFNRQDGSPPRLSILRFLLEPIREVWIHDEWLAASRLSMMRIMARRG